MTVRSITIPTYSNQCLSKIAVRNKNKNSFFQHQTKNNIDPGKSKIPKTNCSGYSEAITPLIESLEQGYYEAFTDVVHKSILLQLNI